MNEINLDEGEQKRFRISREYLPMETESVNTIADVLPNDPEIFWNLESMCIKDDPLVSDDDIALQQFELTVQKVGNRYEVGWPWKPQKEMLTCNYGLSMGRLKSLIRRLRQDDLLFQRHDEIIKEQEVNGIIERVNNNQQPIPGPIYCIPHQPVITPSKTTVHNDGLHQKEKSNKKRKHKHKGTSVTRSSPEINTHPKGPRIVN